MENLTSNPAILEITSEIRNKAAQGQYYLSDIILRRDGQEYQFADLVMEGGGTLGIALVGYIHALEQAGVRFLGIGGSSVGAIVALLAYCCGSRTEAKGDKLAVIIGDMDLGSMVDGDCFAQHLSGLLGQREAWMRTPQIIFYALLSLPQVITKLGLNPGDKLYSWIASCLLDCGVSSLADLKRLIDELPEHLIHRESGAAITDYDTSLRIVVADLTTSTKVIFPEMAPMYWQEADGINPAYFARASAAIPVFFQPPTVTGISGLMGTQEKWERLGSFSGVLPDKVAFADGGLFSNFPIDLFYRPGIPRAPTLGARLGNKNRVVKEVEHITQYAGNLFESMRHYADYDFIFKNPLYKRQITHIPTEKYNWLDFAMSPEDKQGLFQEGVIAGYNFLENFDWAEYKALRAAELEMHRIDSLSRQNRSVKPGVEEQPEPL